MVYSAVKFGNFVWGIRAQEAVENNEKRIVSRDE